MTMDATQLRTLRNRYEAHINSGDHILRPGQKRLADDIVSFMGERNAAGGINDRGYFVRPTGTGKTVSLIDFAIGINTLPGGQSVLGDAQRQKRTLVMAPWNFLVTQWEDELLGKLREDGTRAPSKWGDRIRPEHVGIYRATDSFENKLAALQRPIVVMTYDSARSIMTENIAGNQAKQQQRLQLRQQLAAENFPAVILDEVHDRPRGEATGNFIREYYFGNSFVLGATATHLYKSGRTIGDYLFDGQIPIHETTFREAVNQGEIAPMRNVIAEVQLQQGQIEQLQQITQAALERARRSSNESFDYTEKELERIVEITQRDEAAIRLLQRGFDPDTHKRYRDMKQVWYCASVKHAQNVARKLNEAMHDDNYAVAVHGKMNDEGEDQDMVLLNYQRGNHKAVTNCQLLVHGFDDPQAELCMQLVPSRSPNRVMQQAGRVMRLDPNNRRKIANIVTFVYPGIDQQIFGELVNGFSMIPNPQEFQPSTPSTPSESRGWPDIEGLRVRFTTEEITLFREQRRQQRYTNGLPPKGADMLTVEEMAQELYPRAGREQMNHEIARLQQRIYEPLAAAYDMRQARQQFVGLEDSLAQDGGSILSVRGQRFPVTHIGYFKEKGHARFCIDRAAAGLCRHALFGRVENSRRELLSENTVRRILNVDEQSFAPLIDKVKNAYLDRGAYAQSVEIEHNDTKARIPLAHMGFYAQAQNRSNVGFSMWPDALKPMYKLAHKVSADQAAKWWKDHPQIKLLKTTEWLNRQDVIDQLDISAVSENNTLHNFGELWNQLTTTRQPGPRPRDGEEFQAVIGPARKREEFRCSRKTTIGGEPELCTHRDELEHIKSYLGMETAYEGPGSQGRNRAWD